MSTRLNKSIGINTSYKECKKNIEIMREYGFEYVYLNDWPQEDDDSLRDTANFIKKSGVKLFSAHSPEGCLTPSSDVLKRGKRIIYQASLLGSPRITFHPCPPRIVDNKGSTLDVDKEKEKSDVRNASILKELCRYSSSYGITLSIENRGASYYLWKLDKKFSYHTIQELRKVIELVDEPNIGICLDTGHANRSGIRIDQAILEAGDLLIETHFNDNFGILSEKEGNIINDLHRPPGIGTINWVEVISALEHISYNNPIIFELALKQFERFEEIARITRDNWKAFLKIKEFISSS